MSPGSPAARCMDMSLPAASLPAAQAWVTALDAQACTKGCETQGRQCRPHSICRAEQQPFESAGPCVAQQCHSTHVKGAVVAYVAAPADQHGVQATVSLRGGTVCPGRRSLYPARHLGQWSRACGRYPPASMWQTEAMALHTSPCTALDSCLGQTRHTGGGCCVLRPQAKGRCMRMVTPDVSIGLVQLPDGLGEWRYTKQKLEALPCSGSCVLEGGDLPLGPPL